MMNRRNIGLTETTHTKWRNLRQNYMTHSPRQVTTMRVRVRGQEWRRRKKISLLIILTYVYRYSTEKLTFESIFDAGLLIIAILWQLFNSFIKSAELSIKKMQRVIVNEHFSSLIILHMNTMNDRWAKWKMSTIMRVQSNLCVCHVKSVFLLLQCLILKFRKY